MRTLLPLLVLFPACKKQAEVVEPVRVQNPVEVSLQVVAVSPGTVVSGRAATVTVVGAGFQPGATVSIGAQSANASLRNANQLDVTVPPMGPGSYDVSVMNPDTSEASLAGGLSVRAAEAVTGMTAAIDSCRHVVLYFPSDAAGLSPEGKTQLEGLLPCYQSSGLPIRVEGHADERGTTDYNVSLAQRRALSVADLLISGGVPSNRLVTTSYGEERPSDSGFGEGSWSKNRRVEITVDF